MCQRSSYPIYIVTYYIKWVATSWTCSSAEPATLFFMVVGVERGREEGGTTTDRFHQLESCYASQLVPRAGPATRYQLRDVVVPSVPSVRVEISSVAFEDPRR